MGHNAHVSTGKRAGARRGPRPAPRPRAVPLAYCAAITASAVAWGYLVWLAVDFGRAARSQGIASWLLLALAALGAMACLFGGLMLGVRLLQELGIVRRPTAATGPTAPETSATPAAGGPDPEATPPPPGGRRRA